MNDMQKVSLASDTPVDPFKILEKYYKKDSDLYALLVKHSQDVMNKALDIAKKHPELNVDVAFVAEAAMLHDIGICLTYAPDIHCHGVMPYLCHGYLGREILINEGLPVHALVCERHTGIGMTADDIKEMSLPLPLRDMIPESIEEELICFCDCFFSKTNLEHEKTVTEVRLELEKYTTEVGLKRFDDWCERFL